MSENDGLVAVKRDWFDDSGARVRPELLRRLHLGVTAGGRKRPQPSMCLFAYVLCTDVPGVKHSCSHGDRPHTIKVLVDRGATEAEVFEALRRRMTQQVL